jgi:hypothetical protein
MKLLAKLSPISKLFNFSEDKIFRSYSSFNPLEVELFILPLYSTLSENFINNPQEIKIITLSDFETVRANMDGLPEYVRMPL